MKPPSTLFSSSLVSCFPPISHAILMTTEILTCRMLRAHKPWTGPSPVSRTLPTDHGQFCRSSSPLCRRTQLLVPASPQSPHPHVSNHPPFISTQPLPDLSEPNSSSLISFSKTSALSDYFFSFYGSMVYTVIHNVVSISAVQQSNSALHIYTFFNVLFHYGLSQKTGYSSL